MKKVFFLIGFAMLVCNASVSAQSNKRAIKKTQIKQQKRIKQGVKSGDLTKRETVKLQKQQVNIQRTKKRAKSDGVVSRSERRKLKSKQALASKNIAVKKNNRRKRG